MAHNFKQFPELTNSQMQIYYFQSPHRQITEAIQAKVVRVIDGDTIRVEWAERDFDFPVRMARIAAPELDEKGGIEAQGWLENQILGKEVTVIPTKTRVEKWGRLLAEVNHLGINMSSAEVDMGYATTWENRERAGWF